MVGEVKWFSHLAGKTRALSHTREADNIAHTLTSSHTHTNLKGFGDSASEEESQIESICKHTRSLICHQSVTDTVRARRKRRGEVTKPAKESERTYP